MVQNTAQFEPLVQAVPATAEAGAAGGSGEVLGPFNDIVQRVAVAVWDTTAANIPSGLHWRMLLLTVGIGIVLFVIRSGHGSKDADGQERKIGLIGFLLPRDIYTHISARVDVWLWIIEKDDGETMGSDQRSQANNKLRIVRTPFCGP